MNIPKEVWDKLKIEDKILINTARNNIDINFWGGMLYQLFCVIISSIFLIASLFFLLAQKSISLFKINFFASLFYLGLSFLVYIISIITEHKKSKQIYEKYCKTIKR